MAALYSPRCITNFTSFKTRSTASFPWTLSPSLLHFQLRRRSASMASSTDAAEVSATAGNSETTSDVLVQYVVLRRDLIDTWPLGSVVTQGCHASVAAIWSHKDDPHTIDYCSPTNLDSMHKASRLLYRFSVFFQLHLCYGCELYAAKIIEKCTVYTFQLMNLIHTHINFWYNFFNIRVILFLSCSCILILRVVIMNKIKLGLILFLLDLRV